MTSLVSLDSSLSFSVDLVSGSLGAVSPSFPSTSSPSFSSSSELDSKSKTFLDALMPAFLVSRYSILCLRLAGGSLGLSFLELNTFLAGYCYFFSPSAAYSPVAGTFS